MNQLSILSNTIFYCFADDATTNQTKYDGTNTPWTDFLTTPIEIAMNQVQGRWTPTMAKSALVFGGGPPFRNGQTLHYKSYDRVTETIPILLRATTDRNAQELRQILLNAINGQHGSAVTLRVTNNGGVRDAETEIYSGAIEENPSLFNEERDTGVMRATLTIERAPFFTLRNGHALETSISAAAIGNTGTGTPDNIVAFASDPLGDLIYEGQPTQVIVIPSNSRTYKIFYLATVYSRTYSTTGAAALSTSSTTGTQTALNAPSISDAYTRHDLKARCLMRFTNNTSNVQVRVEVRAHPAGATVFAGPWITPTSGSATLYDMGAIPLDLFRRTPSGSTLQLYIGYRSTNGASATTTLGYNELLLYYDFCRVDVPNGVIPASNPTRLELLSYYTTLRAPQPLPSPVAAAMNSSEALYERATVRGAFPRLINGASIYVAYTEANNVHVTGDTGTVTVRYSPLWFTFPGKDLEP